MTKFATTAAFVLGATLCTAGAAQADDMVIGFAVAQSGGFQPYDESGTKMAQLVIDQINGRGGLLGRRLVTVMADTKSDRVEGVRAAKDVLAAGAELVIVTCDYDFGAPAALEAQKAGVVAVSICAGDAKMGPVGIGPMAFSANRAGPVDGAMMAQWARQKKGFSKAYMITDQTIDYSKSQCAGFEWAWQDLGGELTGRDTFSAADSTVAAQVSALGAAVQKGDVDVVMLCTFLPNGASALRQIRAAGIDVPIMSGEAMAGTFWTEAVPGLSEFYTAQFASVSNDPRPEVQELLTQFEQKHGAPLVEPSAFPIYAWLHLWQKTVTEIGTTEGKAVAAAFESYKEVPTLFGPYTFTNMLHIQDKAQIAVVGIKDGKPDSFELVDAAKPVPQEVLFRRAN